MKKGFTLAEVLITLGIIGVVAAMTLPVLTAKYRANVVETRLKKFYTTMNQAILLSEVQNGDKKYWEYAADFDKDSQIKFFEKYLKNYLKYSKIESFYGSTGLHYLNIYFADGSVARMGWQGKDYEFFPKGSDAKSEETYVSCKNVFIFGLYSDGSSNPARDKYVKDKGMEPYISGDWDGDVKTLKNDKRNCAKMIQLNNWKIPDDYPVKL